MQFQGYIDPTGLLFKRPARKLVMGGDHLLLRTKDGDERAGRFNGQFPEAVGVNGRSSAIRRLDGTGRRGRRVLRAGKDKEYPQGFHELRLSPPRGSRSVFICREARSLRVMHP